MDDRFGTESAGVDVAEGCGAGGGEAAAVGAAVWRGREGRRRLPSEEELVAAARAARERRPGPMTLREFERLTGWNGWYVRRVIPGCWTELRQRVGIPLHPQELNRLSDDELLAEFHRVVCGVGRLPRWNDIKRLSRVSETPFQTRFGPKAELLLRYRDWLERHEPESPFVGEIEAARRRAGARGRRGRGLAGGAGPAVLAGAAGSGVLAGGGGSGRAADGAGAGPVCGEELNFRCFAYAPTNEKGVLVLFGAVAEELGFRVNAIRPGFPDCEAMQALDAGRRQWQRVRIEFEQRSRNFRDHGHDPAGCDLVVCWKHDWEECPVEVLELAAEVRRLRGEG